MRISDWSSDVCSSDLTFLLEVATVLPLPLLCMLQAQRDVCSLGLDLVMYRDQRVDFSLETPQGLRLVIEIDGGQHGSDAAQAHLDKQRDSERSEEHTSELQSLMRISYAVFCLKKKQACVLWKTNDN